MKYSLLIAATIFAFFLAGCGDPKPGQYPPSLYDGSKQGDSQ
ncbi:hypothetical protein SAMN06296273_1814 [Nitrosomonas ureae]|uniref:Lipoprotein-attachment site-containing protein n=1 Tax=Nitrosomonas ureae TaxID=44577 RepID=A0A285BZW4_9PROT|nr:hypothetical protein [Nitrosomonas ureae]SNX60353.1 hypothetical protein SAMN06296273_1814 [Nitrosomonas ureae]